MNKLEKDKYCMNLHMESKLKTSQKQQIGGCQRQGLGVGEMDELCFLFLFSV